MRPEAARLRGLYAITPESADTAKLVEQAEQCLAGGAALLQYRAKDLARGLALLQARELREACRRARVPFIVNDSIELALACQADGVHLGREDAGVREARISMPHAIIGVSCYAQPERAAAAATAGADYVAIGSVFPSSTKPCAVPAPLDRVAQARALSGLPVVAIGGITAQNASLAIGAGADMVATISAIFGAADVRAAAHAIARLFHHEPSSESPDARAQPRAV